MIIVLLKKSIAKWSKPICLISNWKSKKSDEFGSTYILFLIK